MMILAIDPGPEQSAYVIWDGAKRWAGGISPNDEMLTVVYESAGDVPVMAIEKIACYGMAVGAEVFETCVWTGRFMQAWESQTNGAHHRIPRGEIKLHLCRSVRAKDANVRQSLIDRFGAPGTKKAPGALYGVTSHMWAALAVAVTAHDRLTAGVRA